MDKLVWKSIWENEPAPDDSQAMASGSSDSAAATPVPAGEPGAPDNEGEVPQGQKKGKRRDRELRKIERFNSLRCPPSRGEELG